MKVNNVIDFGRFSIFSIPFFSSRLFFLTSSSSSSVCFVYKLIYYIAKLVRIKLADGAISGRLITAPMLYVCISILELAIQFRQVDRHLQMKYYYIYGILELKENGSIARGIVENE